MQSLVKRFLSYVSFDTQSDDDSTSCPSTAGQMVLAQALADELSAMGLEAVSLDDNGYLMARLPSNIEHTVPPIGFIAHMDTAAEASGANVNPQIIANYAGGPIDLAQSGDSLTPEQYPFLHTLVGQDLITTDGTTLLGADDKAGIAEIITAIEYLQGHPEIKHGDICIGFTPDEEIGRGSDHFDVEKFGAKWAYTVDGGPLGELESENFNASSAKVICHGLAVHPGTAKNTMVNAMNIAAQFQVGMPEDETPETTEGREGFYHLTGIKPGVARTELHYILRDFEQEGMARRKAFMQAQVDKLNRALAKGSVELELSDSYFNMAEKIAPHPHIVEIAQLAMQDLDITPIMTPIRGGTDGAQLSYKGLPCPNLFTGGYNFHGEHECISIQSMEKAVALITKIAEKTADFAKAQMA